MKIFRVCLQNQLDYLTMTVTLCSISILPSAVLCGRCQLESQTIKPLHRCTFSQSAISSLLNNNFSSDCQFLDLSINHLKTVDDFIFSKQINLISLDLSFNQIITLRPRAFIGLGELACLDLRQNKLNLTYEAYPKLVFLPLNQLKILDIRNNLSPTTQLLSPDMSFQLMDSLEELQIDLCSTVKLDQGFAHIFNLKLLAASDKSSLQSISAEFFHSFKNLTIETLLLTNTDIRNIDPKAFAYFPLLKHLSLANNRKLGLRTAVNSLVGLSYSPLSSIDLRHVNSAYSDIQDQFITNEITKQLSHFCFRSLDLSDNMIVHMELNSLFHLKKECIEVIKLSHNYLKARSFIPIFFLLVRFQNLRVIYMANSMIAEPNFRKGQTYFYEDLLRSRRSVINISLPPTLEICNISHTHLHCYTSGQEIMINSGSRLRIFDMSYSIGCNCFHRRIRGIENVRSLLISGNEYSKTLNSVYFSSFPNLTSLIMRDVFLMSRFQVDTTLLWPLEQLQHLDMANSGLTTLSSNSLSRLLHLKILDLSFNKLISVPDLSYMSRNVQELDMRSNALISIPLKDREKIDSFVSNPSVLAISLDGNPMVCNCETYYFVQWIWTAKVAFDSDGNYNCIASNGSVIPLLGVGKNIHDLQVRCISSFWVTFGALAACILFVTLMISALVYRYRVPIKYWCHTLCYKPEAKPSQRHKYDALVAYCHQDYRWVCQILYLKLTDSNHGTGYKLCVYDRDFLPGVPIEENIITAINSSFKIILVISPAFVQSTWCQFELQMARMKMVQEGREDVIIPILLKDVPVSLMPKSLLNLWNTSVFLVWSESPGEQRHFWENLMAALGPVSDRRDLIDDDYDRNSEDQGIVEEEDEPIMVLNPDDEELLLRTRYNDDEPRLEF